MIIFSSPWRELRWRFRRARLAVYAEQGWDATRLIQQTLDEYGIVDLPAGTFLISSTLKAPKIIGAGRDITVLKQIN